ncbi:hypothetical protein [Streptomyces halobius]|uniref:Uncharacterized protein n=1 Tax=Streptomyces halobius TaxID=2879846 RepID=A0ABY4LYZ5_9ACTN|nr:hypothetical protein [Streptomyces halobius]UQA90690.1 hypothetical protein K9S39_01200 [Streptomyces halobius]
MSDLLISVLVIATAVRVFAPDAMRLARRGLAAGVRVGAASLAGHRPTVGPSCQHLEVALLLPADEGEGA